MNLQRVSITTIHPDPANARLHDERNLDAIKGSLARFGQQRPIVVDHAGMIRAGNGTYLAAKALGWETIQVVVTDLGGLEATAYSIADNRTSDLSSFDEAALAKLLQELQAEDSLAGTGFDEKELDDLIAELEAESRNEVEDPGPEEPPEKPTSRTGDLWLLGDHRLLCGDSTKPEDLSRLMAGARAKLLSTDPPYCVEYTGNNRPVHDGKRSGKDWSHVYREVDIADLGEFLDAFLRAALPHADDDAPIYMWHAHVQQPVVAQVFERHGILFHQVLVWVKPTAVFGHSYYQWRHEPCAFGWKQGHKPSHGEAQLSSVWEADWDGKARHSTFHPCLHPDAVVLTEAGYRPIQSITIGDRVYAADGSFHAVADVSSHRYQSPELIRIVAKGGNVPTLASDNHPFLVWRPERMKGRVVGGSVSWVRADELRLGDYTMTPVVAEADTDPFPDRDEEFWFLFGLYLAQGSIQKAGHGEHRYPSFALHKKRQDLIGRIREKWTSVGEYDPNDYGSAPSQGVTVMAFDADAGAVFEELGGRRANAKRIAPIVMQLPRAKRFAVVQGWLNGDGCRVHNRTYWQGKTTSPDMAAQLALLGESVGYKTNVFRYEPPPELGSIAGRKFKSQQPEFHLYFFERGSTPGGGRITHLDHDGQNFVLRYVKSVDRVPYEGDVWNLTVEGSPTFQTSVGMSHNTSKPTRLFEIPMEQHTRPRDVVLEPFSGSGSQIIAAEKLRRRCYAMELTPAFVDGTIVRWQKATGKEAVLETGETFARVAEERT